jgi:hypothetical protein
VSESINDIVSNLYKKVIALKQAYDKSIIEHHKLESKIELLERKNIELEDQIKNLQIIQKAEITLQPGDNPELKKEINKYIKLIDKVIAKLNTEQG